MGKAKEHKPVIKKKRKPGGGRVKRFGTESDTVALRVPASKKDYYKELFNSIVNEDLLTDNQAVI